MTLNRRLRAVVSSSERLLWAVRVRWLVIGGFLVLAVVAWLGGALSSPLPCVAAAVVGGPLNALNHVCVRRGRYVIAVTAVAIPFDHLLITYVVANTGGVESPFVMMYFVQVVATAMLVDPLIAVASAGCAVLLWMLGMELLDAGWIGAAGLVVPPGPGSELRLLWGAFLVYCLGLLVYLGGYIGQRLRASEEDLHAKNRQLTITLASLQQAYEKQMQAEGQLIQSEKMRALGQLVAGVAHELNNPISFIAANVDILRTYTDRMCMALQTSDADPASRIEDVLTDLPALLADCEEGARRAQEIVNQLRTFSRQEDGTRWRQTDLARDIEATVGLLSHRFKGRVAVHRDVGCLPGIECLPGQINQVLMNLLVNAADALGERDGNIWIGAREGGADEPHGRAVVLTVRDDGAGMAPEVLERIFDPFFTTKEPGQGTGLGLAVSYAIIERHHGRIEVESRPGTGTCFTVTLPVWQSSGGAPAAANKR